MLIRACLFILLVLVCRSGQQSYGKGKPQFSHKLRQRPYYDYNNGDYDSFGFQATLPPYTRRISRPGGNSRSISGRFATTLPPPMRFTGYRPNGFVDTITIAPVDRYLPRGVNSDKSAKILKMDIRVQSNDDVESADFKHSMANRLSYLLYLMRLLANGEDSMITGRPFDAEPYSSDVLVFGASRKGGGLVQLDFTLMANSSILDADAVSGLIMDNVRAYELGRIIGYPIVSLPTALATTSYRSSSGFGINKILRIVFDYLREPKDLFYHRVYSWLNEVYAPYAQRLFNITGNATAVITNVQFFDNMAAIDFTLNLGQAFLVDRNASELAWNLFSAPPPPGMQLALNYSILSGGYVDASVRPKRYVEFYNRSIDSFRLEPKQMSVTTPSIDEGNGNNYNASFPKLIQETDQIARIVFSLPDDREDKRQQLEIAARKWANVFVGPFVKRAFGTNLNSTVYILSASFPPQSMVMDFAILFEMQRFPLVANATEVAEEMYSKYFHIVQASFPSHKIISGGYLKLVVENGASKQVYIIVNSTSNATSVSGTIPISRTTKASIILIPTLVPATTVRPSIPGISSTTPKGFQSTTAGQRGVTSPPDTSFSLAIESTDQIVRIAFDVPFDAAITEKELDSSVRNWLNNYVAPFIKRSFDVNYTASAVVFNKSRTDNSYSTDFAVLFGPPAMVANATQVAIALLSKSLGQTQGGAPYPILSGGYMAPNQDESSNGNKTFITLYSSSSGRPRWATPNYEPRNMLYMELKVPTVVDVSSTQFRQLIANRLRQVILPVFQQQTVADNIYTDSARYTMTPNFYDVILIDAQRIGSMDSETAGITFVIVANSTMLNGAVAANALALNTQQDALQKAMGYTVVLVPTAVSSIKAKQVAEPESNLWIIAAVVVPLIIIIILINVCILACCRPNRPNQAPVKQDNAALLPSQQQQQQQQQQPGAAATLAGNSNYPFLYYYQPIGWAPPGVEKHPQHVEKSVTIKVPENHHAMSSPEASIATISPPARVNYSLMNNRPRMYNRRTKRRVTPIAAEHSPAVISQVASSLLREAFRNMSMEDIRRISDGPERRVDSGLPSDVADQVCQTEDSLQAMQGGDKPWTREYELSLLRLASMVVAPNGVQPNRPPSTGYMTIPHHGAIVAHALKNTAHLADGTSAPILPNEPPSKKDDNKPLAASELEKKDEYLDMGDSQMKQLERLNALFMSIPPSSTTAGGGNNWQQPTAPVDNKQGEKAGTYADEHDVIVDSLKPGVPPRQLLEAIRTELERYGQK